MRNNLQKNIADLLNTMLFNTVRLVILIIFDSAWIYVQKESLVWTVSITVPVKMAHCVLQLMALVRVVPVGWVKSAINVSARKNTGGLIVQRSVENI